MSYCMLILQGQHTASRSHAFDGFHDLTWHDPDFIFQLLGFVPVAEVGSRRLILLIPDLQAVLFCGSMPPMLQAFTSAFTQSDHVFLGLPRAFVHGTSILVRLDTGWRSDDVSITSKMLRAYSSCYLLYSQPCTQQINGDFIMWLDATDPSDRWSVISA